MDNPAQVTSFEMDALDLSHGDFSEIVIEGDLSGIDLHEADFKGSIIENADLSNTYLRDAQFQGAHLSQADLSSSYGLDFSGASFTGSVNLYGLKMQDEVYRAAAPDGDHHKSHNHDHSPMQMYEARPLGHPFSWTDGRRNYSLREEDFPDYD